MQLKTHTTAYNALKNIGVRHPRHQSWLQENGYSTDNLCCMTLNGRSKALILTTVCVERVVFSNNNPDSICEVLKGSFRCMRRSFRRWEWARTSGASTCCNTSTKWLENIYFAHQLHPRRLSCSFYNKANQAVTPRLIGNNLCQMAATNSTTGGHRNTWPKLTLTVQASVGISPRTMSQRTGPRVAKYVEKYVTKALWAARYSRPCAEECEEEQAWEPSGQGVFI